MDEPGWRLGSWISASPLVGPEDAEAALARFPFLAGYLDQVADLGLDGVAFARRLEGREAPEPGGTED